MRASITIQTVDHRTKRVWVTDNDGRVSVTNDAEAVVKYINHSYPNYRIIYRDTMGNWDELLHVNGDFTGFTTARMEALP